MTASRAYDVVAISRYLLENTSFRYRLRHYGGLFSDAERNTLIVMLGVAAALVRMQKPRGAITGVEAIKAHSMCCKHPELRALLQEHLPDWDSAESESHPGFAVLNHTGTPQSGKATWDDRVAADSVRVVRQILHDFPEHRERLPQRLTATFDLFLCGFATWVSEIADKLPVGERTYSQSEQAWEDLYPSLRLNIPAFFRDRQICLPFDLRPIQESMWQLPVTEETRMPLVTLEAGTAEGKTLGALLYFVRLLQVGAVDSLIWALNTRAAIPNMACKIQALLSAFYDGPSPEVSQGLFGIEDPVWGDNHNHHLSKAVVVTTIDQVCKSVKNTPFFPMRMASSMRSLLVLDELHGSNIELRAPIRAILRQRSVTYAPSVTMSATLVSDLLEDEILGCPVERPVPYPAIIEARQSRIIRVSAPSSSLDNQRQIRVSTAPIMHDYEAIAELALNLARTGRKVALVRNINSDVVDTFTVVHRRAVEQGRLDLLFAPQGMMGGTVPMPFYSNFVLADILQSEAFLQTQFEERRRPGPCLVVGSRAIYDGMELDFDVVLTDLIPMDRLVHLLGRVERHSGTHRVGTPEVIVLVPGFHRAEFANQALSEGGSLRRFGFGIGRNSIHFDLRALDATWEAIETHGQFNLPRQVRELVETCVNLLLLKGRAEATGDPRWIAHSRMVEIENNNRNRRGNANIASSIDGNLAPGLMARGQGYTILRVQNPGRSSLGNLVSKMLIGTSKIKLGDRKLPTSIDVVRESIGNQQIFHGVGVSINPVLYDNVGCRGLSNQGEDEGD